MVEASGQQPKKKYITSPGYPNKYENDLSCTYFIYGKNKLLVEFEDFALEGDYPTCRNDNVTFTSSPKQTYCGHTKPPAINARFAVFITFKSDVWISDSGFKFSFRTNDCGENIKEPTIINSPMFPITPYVIRDICLWNITAPKNKVIMMKFTNYSEVSSYSSCLGNGLDIYDGPNFENRLNKICDAQNMQIPVITSSGNMALISLERTERTKTSFTAEILFTPGPADGCGGTFALNQTKVIQPPKNFTNADCQWKFEAQEGYKVEFRIESLKLPEGCSQSRGHGKKNCTCSYIEIRDGTGPFSEEIDQFCSNSTSYSQVYTTSWKFGFLRFYTETEYLENAFKITIKPVADICGPRNYWANKSIQTLTSPGYPLAYKPNIQCRWVIKNPNHYRQKIVVRFTEFDLTNSTEHEDKNLCSGDRLEIDDIDESIRSHRETMRKQISKKSSGSTFELGNGEIMQFCGKQLKVSTIRVSRMNMYIKFISTSELNKGKGFKIEYSLSECSNNFTQNSGSIYAAQDNEKDCMMYITSSENTTLSLHFDTFWQGYRNNCSSAALQVYDGHSKQSPKLLNYCGTVLPSPVFSSTNKMLIILSSQQAYSHSTLGATFLASSDGKGCGGTIFDQSGTISSPMYPNKYTNDTICTWELSVPIGAQISANFRSFEINGPCETNYLKVITYENGKSNERTFCSRDRIAQLTSANKMTITYKSSVFNTGTGWLMKFRRSAKIMLWDRPTPIRPFYTGRFGSYGSFPRYG